MYKSPPEWEAELKELGALRYHDGNMLRPHYLLTSGKHSNGFCNCEILMENTTLLTKACYDLVALLKQAGLDIALPDRVVGPAMGAITIAHEVALHMGVARNRPCLRAYVEKPTEPGGPMTFTRTAIKPGERVLLVEDVLTTGGSVERARAAVEKAGGEVLPFVAVLVNRSGLVHLDDVPIIALVHKCLPTWEPDECPLCTQGSEAIRPKGTENWARLTADYP